MSATNRGAAREDLDFYGTPAWATYAILKRLNLSLTSRVLEPGCGDGAILDELRRCGYRNLVGVELDAYRSSIARAKGHLVTQQDFLGSPPAGPLAYDAAIGNPPYTLAMEFVQRSMLYAPCVVQLLRLNWLSSGRRAAWHAKNPAHVHVLSKRPSFTGDGKTDATEYAWFQWGGPGYIAGHWEILST